MFLAVTVLASPAVAWTPTDGPTFNRPNAGPGKRLVIVNRIERAIDNTPRDATIRIATYLMDRKQSVDKLLAAHRRGVNVKVVMDDGIESAPSRRLARALGNNPKRRSWAIFCHNSCRGTRGQMHSKFYAFSRAGGADRVVMVSSANLNNGGTNLGWNDLFTMTGKRAIYNRYARIHANMALDRPIQPPRARYQVHSVGRFQSHFFPKPGVTKRTDPVYRAMSKIHCRGVRGGAGRYGRTAINVSMFWWSGDRGMYLARRLLALQREGCRVSVTYGAPSNAVAAVLRKAAWQGRIALYDSRKHRNSDGVVDVRVHTKYLLVNGHYGSDRSSWQVFTGSANWVAGSLTGGDEVMLRVTSRPAYVRYVDHYDFVRKYGARRIGRS
ncbi:MAG: phospholipase D-like domain-containing protein [Actinomycetota bacterium]|nr:phospholipase D-like domain-containing protein [Actinomycetota bacterium]